MQVKPVILGIKGAELSREERELFKTHRPLGVILFRRNIEFVEGKDCIIQNKRRLIDLTRSIKEVLGDQSIICIDQEGGRVKRLVSPTFKDAPSAQTFGDMSRKEGIIECKRNYKEIAKELRELGINLNFAPVADLRYKEAHDVVGDRSFGANQETVVSLCEAALEGMREEKVIGCIKHIPGHGRATVDSHKSLPVIEASLEELEKTDFAVFRKLARFCALAMTAHVIYKAIDPDNPATLSEKVINYIKEKIGFKGLIISDAIDMKALSGSMFNITKKSFAAGIDIVLECTGNIDNMTVVLDAADEVSIDKFSNL